MRNFFSTFKRHFLIYIAVLLVGLFSAYYASTSFHFFYDAHSVLLIEDDPDLDDPILSARARENIERNLSSRRLAWVVVQKLNLLGDPEFNDRYRAGAWTELDIQNVLSVFLSRLDVRVLSVRQKNRQAIEVHFRSQDPAKAALIADTLSDVFIEMRKNAQARSAKRLTARLEAYLAQLQRELRDAQTEFKSVQDQIVAQKEDDPKEVTEDRSENIQSELIKARAAFAQAEARLKNIKKSGGSKMNSGDLVEFLDNSDMRNLHKKFNDLKKGIKDLSGRYGPKHPEMLAMNNAIKPLEKQIKEQAEKLVQRTRAQITKNKKRVASLEEELQSILPAAGDDNVEEVEAPEVLQMRAEALERDVKAKQMMFDHFLNNYQLDAELARIQKPSLRVLYYASVPNVPVYPKSQFMVILGAVAALLLAWVLVVIGQKLFGQKKVNISI